MEESIEGDYFIYHDTYNGIVFEIVAKYKSEEQELDVTVERVQDRYDDYDILSDGFGGDEEAFSSFSSDGYWFELDTLRILSI